MANGLTILYSIQDNSPDAHFFFLHVVTQKLIFQIFKYRYLNTIVLVFLSYA